MMEKSRQRRGRLTRLGWSLAIVLLITPAQALAGSEWTLDGPEPAAVESLQPIDHGDPLQIDRVEGADSRKDAKDGDSTGGGEAPIQLRGSEWT